MRCVDVSQNDLRCYGEKSRVESTNSTISPCLLRKHPRNEGVAFAEELGTMSKNILNGTTLGIRAVWRIHSLTSSSLDDYHFLFVKLQFCSKI